MRAEAEIRNPKGGRNHARSRAAATEKAVHFPPGGESSMAIHATVLTVMCAAIGAAIVFVFDNSQHIASPKIR